MDPLRTAHLNEESPRQIHDRLRFYRSHNAKLLEYFPDGTFRVLSRDDSLLDVALLATTPFPGIQPAQVQQLMNTLRYFLFDLQNSRLEFVPHQGPDQTLSNMIFYRAYADGGYGIIVPVQASAYGKFMLNPAMRQQLAETPLEDEVQMQQSFAAQGNGYYLDVLINRVIFHFRREVRKIELQERLQTMVREQYPRSPVAAAKNSHHRRHWSMVS
ncbi:hypothetical protein FB45DRAFT_906564 [Roridomyces roridus]|uniref:Uncharacterized protein n=1 Tax=Roridomyces roridus TaxID=1738132 RepID=A0AAD7C1G5_9AGAR|nr:hypothetical protein FB45DRAFT_906564 [Roridomyces roridus]